MVLVLFFLFLMIIGFFLFLQSYTMILCANWFPIVMILIALAFFFRMKNGGKR